MAIWHNGNAYNYAVYDAQNKLINSSDGFDAPPYKDVRNGIIQSVDNAIGYKPSGGGFDMVHILAKIKKSYKIRELKDKIWSSIKYNPETHLCRMLKDELFIINKETGKIDNPYDYANISLKNYFITYRNYTDGTCMTSATEDINSGIPQNPEKKIDINDDNPISFGLK